ncbi:MAG: signal peptidase II [Simkaniaceae bacterium]|nr:signal peptidase II [Simkaniaceae bacterium]
MKRGFCNVSGLLFVVGAALLLAVDAGLKYGIYALLRQPIPLFRNVWGIDGFIDRVLNSGGAWGILEGHPTLVLVLRISACAVVVIHAFRMRGSGDRLLRGALFCIITGALGNIADGFVYGCVVDMFRVTFRGYTFPVFNVADIAISVGTGLFILHAFLRKA